MRFLKETLTLIPLLPQPAAAPVVDTNVDILILNRGPGNDGMNDSILTAKAGTKPPGAGWPVDSLVENSVLGL